MTLTPTDKQLLLAVLAAGLLLRSAWLIWRTGALMDRGQPVPGEIVGWEQRGSNSLTYWHARIRYRAGGMTREFVSQLGEAQRGPLGPVEVTVDQQVPSRAEIVPWWRAYLSALVGVVLAVMLLVTAFG